MKAVSRSPIRFVRFREKLIRRHPHIFGPTGSHVRTAGQVVEQWEQIKAREQKDAGERRSLLRGVPSTLPSLLRAHEIGTRVAAVGFDWAQTTDVVDKIEEEVAELTPRSRPRGHQRTEEEMGDLLFSIANLARKLGIEPESALRKANEKFSARFEALERAFESQGRSIHEATLEEMEAEWQEAKSTPQSSDDAATASVELHGPTATSKKRRTEEPKKKTEYISSSKRSSRSGAGRRPATEVMRVTTRIQTTLDRGAACICDVTRLLRPRFARPDRRQHSSEAHPSAAAH